MNSLCDDNSRSFTAERFDRGDVKQRKDLELGWHILIVNIYTNENTGAGEQSSFGVLDFKRLPAGQRQSKRLKGSPGECLAKGLNGHVQSLSVCFNGQLRSVI